MSTGPLSSALAGRAPTLAELQVELGSDNAYSLVAKIGELALSQGLGQAGGSVEGAVDRVLGSLTREERLTMAAGGMPPRVMELIGAEAETAKVHQRQQNVEQHRADNAAALAAGAFILGRGVGSLAALRNMPGHGSGERPSSSSVADGHASGYAGMNFGNSESLKRITSSTYGTTPFAATGMNWNTFNYMRDYVQRHDPQITGQNILDAAKDVKKFNLSPNDKGAVRDQATIRHYDDKPEETNKALEKFSKLSDEDKEKLKKLNLDLANAKTPEARKEAEQALKSFHDDRSKKTGVQERIEQTPHPKAKEAIKGQKERIEESLNQKTAPGVKPSGEQEIKGSTIEKKSEAEKSESAKPAQSEAPKNREGSRSKLQKTAAP